MARSRLRSQSRGERDLKLPCKGLGRKTDWHLPSKDLAQKNLKYLRLTNTSPVNGVARIRRCPNLAFLAGRFWENKVGTIWKSHYYH
jgi:hypothetical protein